MNNYSPLKDYKQINGNKPFSEIVLILGVLSIISMVDKTGALLEELMNVAEMLWLQPSRIEFHGYEWTVGEASIISSPFLLHDLKKLFCII